MTTPKVTIQSLKFLIFKFKSNFPSFVPFQHSCGKAFKFESKCNKELSGNIYEFGKNLGLKIQKGNTMSCDGFYEGFIL